MKKRIILLFDFSFMRGNIINKVAVHNTVNK